jgi:hypothetical protein
VEVVQVHTSFDSVPIDATAVVVPPSPTAAHRVVLGQLTLRNCVGVEPCGTTSVGVDHDQVFDASMPTATIAVAASYPTATHSVVEGQLRDFKMPPPVLSGVISLPVVQDQLPAADVPTEKND